MARPEWTGPDWGHVAARAAEAIADDSVHAVWRALNYLCAAQLYLQDNCRLERPLRATDVKEHPSGHWGVCPPVNLALAHLGPVIVHTPPRGEVLLVHGAGHAGPSALAYAYLTGRLGETNPRLSPSSGSMRAFLTGFPHTETTGGEITPLLPGHLYMGGQLGPALPFAQGAALDAPERLVIPLIGDGECETGMTSASWLAARALAGTGTHGTVLPVVLLNGQRMGGPSLLSGLSRTQQTAYFTAAGYRPIFTDGSDTAAVRPALREALAHARPLHDGPSALLVLTLPKGHTGPEQIDGRPIAGTVHKTPLVDPRHDRREREALQRWLSGYRPVELFDEEGRPTETVRDALPDRRPLPRNPFPATQDCGRAPVSSVRAEHESSFSDLIPPVLRDSADREAFRVFSPDELSSNRVHLADREGRLPTWVVEILNEEICHAWAQGYTESGRRALVITYEAFAPLADSLLVQQLKYRAVARNTARPRVPSITYLLTSLSWNNTYTHQNPSLVSTLLATEDSSVHIYTPADAERAAADLTRALGDLDRCNLVVASKHPMPVHPTATMEEELRRGMAIWPHLSDPGEPDLTLVSAGDVPAREASTAARRIRAQRPGACLRYVHVNDLTILGDPSVWPLALHQRDFHETLGEQAPVLLVVPFRPEAARGLLFHRPDAHRFHVRGYRDPGQPLSANRLLRRCGMDASSLSAYALHLLSQPHEPLPEHQQEVTRS